MCASMNNQCCTQAIKNQPLKYTARPFVASADRHEGDLLVSSPPKPSSKLKQAGVEVLFLSVTIYIFFHLSSLDNAFKEIGNCHTGPVTTMCIVVVI